MTVLTQQEGPLVSVILPVFNNGPFLMLAVQSIINQSYQNWELIVIDDGSNDNACGPVELIEDPRIRVLRHPVNKGLAHRLNEGVKEAAGVYIARMDADDVSFPTRLAEQVQYLEAHSDIDLVGCRAVVFRFGHGVLGLLPFAEEHLTLVSRPWNNIPLPHPTWMGRKIWFEKNPYYIPEVRRSEDQELLLRTYLSSRFACLPTVLLGYQQGVFRLKRTLLARKELGVAQLKLFLRRKEYSYAFLSLLISSLKILVDLMSAIPGCEKLFFFRMISIVPPKVISILYLCLSTENSRL